MTLKIDIDAAGSAPAYEQVRAQITEQAHAGVLPVGYKLPTVRGLAGTLGLAPNTVAKAYRVLETDGVIETRGRLGTYVAAAGDGVERVAAEAAREFALRMRRLGLPADDVVAAARQAVRAVYGD